MFRKSAPKLNNLNWMDEVRQAGFEVGEIRPGIARVSKHGCAAVLETSPDGQPRFAVPPGLLIGDQVAHLYDVGYQKFWQDDQRRLPALAAQLKALHRFNQDFRAALGKTTLYNEALGTVSARYVYDRLEGRESPQKNPTFPS